MAKTPAKTNAPAAKEGPKVGAASAKTTAPATKTAEQIAADEADAAEAQRLKDEEEAKAKAAADAAGKSSDQNQGENKSGESVDVEAIKEAAYKEGYTNGFSAALDELADGQNEGTQTEGPTEAYAGSDQSSYHRERLICLALFTPENQRKGGLFVVVDRLQEYLDSLPAEERDAAISFMAAIAQTSPIDLASGRFKLIVNEALSAIEGGRKDPLSDENASERGEAAAARMAEAMPDLDAEPQDDEAVTLDPEVDLTDADSPAAAAQRLAGL